MNDRMSKAVDLFAQALQCPPKERSEFLLEACAGDSILLKEVESLLRHDHEAHTRFLNPASSPLERGDDPTLSSPERPNSPPAGNETVDASSSPVIARPISALPIDGYDDLRELGRGGQGVVYAAMQRGTKRTVAIKVLLNGQYASPADRKRFQREIEVVAHLKHPGIATIFHSGETSDARPYYVMDFVDGAPLNRHVRNNNLLIADALGLFAQVCVPVQYAHEHGIVHRDLKPSNILVDEKGKPKIMDFGLAKPLANPPTTTISQPHQIVGTLPYMSPEQARGDADKIDIRTDVYALGVVLYELLTGRYPYPISGNTTDVLRHIIDTPPTPPSRAWSADCGVAECTSRAHSSTRSPIDTRLETIVLRALSKERERRYQSVSALRNDVLAYLADEPIAARPDSWRYRLRRWARRHTIFIIASALYFAAYAAGSADLGWVAPIVVATSLWAAWDSSRIELTKYRSSLRYSPVKLFFAMLGLWIVGFPWYLVLRRRILAGTMPRAIDDEKPRTNVLVCTSLLLYVGVTIIVVFAIA
ncbi:Serine/threonine-protein kinase PknB [Phycisphaerae bacterium RAS1]|nr:Serine/threonine-protein kinase PknB [Phycisphaerae bacterium RAS1]